MTEVLWAALEERAGMLQRWSGVMHKWKRAKEVLGTIKFPSCVHPSHIRHTWATPGRGKASPTRFILDRDKEDGRCCSTEWTGLERWAERWRVGHERETWGIVGHSLNFLTPSRISGSSSTFRLPNSTPANAIPPSLIISERIPVSAPGCDKIRKFQPSGCSRRNEDEEEFL